MHLGEVVKQHVTPKIGYKEYLQIYKVYKVPWKQMKKTRHLQEKNMYQLNFGNLQTVIFYKQQVNYVFDFRITYNNVF